MALLLLTLLCVLVFFAFDTFPWACACDCNRIHQSSFLLLVAAAHLSSVCSSLTRRSSSFSPFSGQLSALLQYIHLCANRRTSSFGVVVFDPSLLAYHLNSMFVLIAPLRPLQHLPLERAYVFCLDFGWLVLTDLCLSCALFLYNMSLRGLRFDSFWEGFSHVRDKQHVAASAAVFAAVGYRRVVRA